MVAPWLGCFQMSLNVNVSKVSQTFEVTGDDGPDKVTAFTKNLIQYHYFKLSKLNLNVY